MPHARFFFDYGSGTALWAGDAVGQQTWGYAMDLDHLPISPDLCKELSELVTWYDTSLNRESPSEPSPWRESQCREFNETVRRTVGTLRAELGTEWQITDQFAEIHEDADLDRYLADPQAFRR